VVGGIKSGAFKDDTNRRVDFAKRLFSTFRAPGQGRVCELLGALKLNAAVFTPIGINRHAAPQTTFPSKYYFQAIIIVSFNKDDK
jgi:hypothetical protein